MHKRNHLFMVAMFVLTLSHYSGKKLRKWEQFYTEHFTEERLNQ